MTTQTCPDRAMLESFLLGKLSESEQSAMNHHLEACTDCMSLANTLTPQDDITRAIRSGKVLSGDEAAVAQAIEKGKQLGSQLQTRMNADDETLIGDKPSHPESGPQSVQVTESGNSDSSQEAIDFLAPAQQPDEIGRLGEYRVLQLLGAGGMGMVFRAEDTRLKRQVALKVMKPSVAANRSAKDRFLREAQFTAAIEHDNIVQIYQVGEDRGVPFIAMPFLKGESLKSRQERVGKLSQSDVIKIGIQVASGLAAAHERNLIHRDIKPDNIWIEEKTGRAKILDFGLVRATSEDAGLTQSGVVMGTPRYMAPEQAMGQDVDHRCDLFSLGAVLYHLVSGKLPFEGSNVTATLMAVVQKEAVPLDRLISGLHPTLCKLIHKLMSKDREKRPKAAKEVARLLTAILQDLRQGANKSADSLTVVPPAEALRTMASPGTDSEATVPSPSPVQPVASRQAESASPPHQPSTPVQPPKRWWLTALGAAGCLAMLLGVIVITITDKDGKKTTLRVPEGTETDVVADPGSQISIRHEAGSVAASSKPSMNKPSASQPEPGKPAPSNAAKTTPSVAPTMAGPVAAVPVDFTPAKPLGTWEMGPEPEWFRETGHFTPYLLKESPVLPGLVVRPAKLAGIKRWNVDTVASRSRIHVVKYSPDGKWIATGGMDGHVRIYDARTQDLHRLLPGRAIQAGVYDVSWHPDSDRLAIVADQGTALRIIDRSGHVLLEERFPGELTNVAWNHSGTQFAVGIGVMGDYSSQGKAYLEIRDPNGKLVKSLASEKGMSCHRTGNVVWSPDDKQLAVRHLDDKVRLWNVETGDAQVLCETPSEHVSCPTIAWSKDDWIAVSTGQGTQLYNPDYKLIRTLEITYGQPIWSPDGKRIIVLTHGPQRVVARDTGAVIAEGAIIAVVGDWHPDGTQLAGGYGDFTVVSADLQTANRRYSGFNAELMGSGSDWSPDGRWLAIARVGRVFSEDGREQPFVFENKPADAQWFQGREALATIWRPDSQLLIGGRTLIPFPNQPHLMHLWARTADGMTRKFFEDPTNPDQGWGMVPRCWSPDGKYLIVTYGKGTLLVLDATGKLVNTIPTGGTYEYGPHACWNPVTNLVAVLENGQPLKFLDPAREWELTPVSDKPLTYHSDFPPKWNPGGTVLMTLHGGWYDQDGALIPSTPDYWSASWAPDGSRFVGSGEDIRFRLHRANGELIRTVNLNGGSASHAWHPRGHLIAQATTNSVVTVWRESDLQPHWHALLLPEGRSATFSAAGELLNEQPADLDRDLIYYLDRGDGQIETVTPAEFRKLTARP